MPTFKDPSGAYHWTSMSAAPSGAPPGAAEGSTWTLTTGVKYRYNQAESLWVLLDSQPAHTFVVLGASTADIADLTSPGASLDGLTLADEDGAYFLLKDQSTGAENGVYKYTHSTTTLSRAEYMDNDQELVGGVEVRVNEGTANADTSWRCTTNDAITVGTTATTWAQAGGNVSGPASSTDNAVSRWDGTGGRTLQDSAVLIDDSDNITGATSLTVGTSTVLTGETASGPATLALAEDTDNGTNTVTLSAPISVSTSRAHYLPEGNGNGTVLTTTENTVTDVVITAAGGAGGATAGTFSLQVNDRAGNAISRTGVVFVITSSTQYGGLGDLNTNVTFNTASTGSILGSGNGWATVKTDATGAFACATANSSDETVYFTAATPSGGVDGVGAGVIVAGCVPDDATWAA